MISYLPFVFLLAIPFLCDLSQDQVLWSDLNPLLNSCLKWTKFKAFADDKLNAGKIKIFVFERVENIVGKGENAGYQHFLLFPQCCQKRSLLGSLKVGIVW